MALSRRERVIVAGTLAAVALFAFDRLLLTPVLDRREATRLALENARADLEEARVLFERRARLAPRWRAMLDAGLGATLEGAEGRALHAVRDGCREAGLSLTSLRREQTGARDGFGEIVFRASATGSLAAVTRFLWRLESSSLPIRMTELRLSARKEASDDLSLEMRISALHLPPHESDAAAGPAGGAERRSGGTAGD